jgi:hypothetical protein
MAAQIPSSSETLDWYKSRGDYLVPEIRKEIRKGLSAEDRTTESEIQYDVISTWNANAQAVRLHGVERTGIGAGLLAVIDWVSTALAIESRLNRPQCAAEYVTALKDTILNNSDAAAGSGNFRIVGSPFLFAQSQPKICSGVSMAAFRADQKADDLRELWISGSLDFIVAHELGHHVLGHTSSNPSSYPESRARESAADKFAFKTMASAGSNPVLSMPIFILWAELEGFSIEGEGTHPAGIKRMRAMIAAAQELIDSDPEMKEAMRRNDSKGSWQKLVRNLDAQIGAIEER